MQMYGLVRRSEEGGDIEFLSMWAPTYDPDDCLKPDHLFVGCDTIEEGMAALRGRTPANPDLAALSGGMTVLAAWCGYHDSGPVVTASEKLIISGVHRNSRYDTDSAVVGKLAAALVKSGGAVLGPCESSWSRLSDTQLVNALRKNPTFAASDLTIRSLKNGYHEVVVDKRKAAARRTTRKNRTAEAAEKKIADAAKEKIEAARGVRRRALFGALCEAGRVLWNTIPEFKVLKEINEYGVCGYEWDQYTTVRFWRVVALHERLVKKGAWRAFREVDAALDAYAAVVEGDLVTSDRVNAEDKKEWENARSRYEVEVARLSRRRRREQLSREKGAKTESRKKGAAAV